MNEKTSGSGKRKILIGGGIAAAVAVAISTGLFPPGTDTAGTIVPAERYRAQMNEYRDAMQELFGGRKVRSALLLSGGVLCEM